VTSAVYFDSGVFLRVFAGNDPDGHILELLKELKRKKVKVYTSIITVEEVSVEHFRKGKMTTDNYLKIHKFARIEGISPEIALTTAKFEAFLLDSAATLDDGQKAKENKRRRWDVFHIATALSLKCSVFYCSDDDFGHMQKRLGITSMTFVEPRPENLPLDLRDAAPEATMLSIAPTKGVEIDKVDGGKQPPSPPIPDVKVDVKR
jgi:predicted nucleic acid-binding protein